jgi:hypothetical protein
MAGRVFGVPSYRDFSVPKSCLQPKAAEGRDPSPVADVVRIARQTVIGRQKVLSGVHNRADAQ